MAAIQTGPIGAGTSLRAQLDDAGLASTLQFDITDTQPGAKTRLEATTCYVTAADLRAHGVDPVSEESRQLQALHFVY